MPKLSPKNRFILETLKAHYPDPQPPLKHRNTFELLLAVILSAQCTDERVNQVTPQLFPQTHPCQPEDILKFSLEEIKKIIYSCGYFNSKAKAIYETSLALQGQEVPANFEALCALPGVGAKTAQVVLAQAFHQDAFPVDTHIHRICNRLGWANSGKNRDKTERQVKALLPAEVWSDLHLQLIFFGREYCKAFQPKCGSCPLREACPYTEKNLGNF